MQPDTVTSPAAISTQDRDPRAIALARHLGLDMTPDGDGDILALDTDISAESDNIYSYGRQEFLVLTDEEAEEAAQEAMATGLWACNVSFLSRYVPALCDRRAAKAWETMAKELCEDAQPLVEALLGRRLDESIRDGVNEDGRGHFLAGYDGEEYEESVDGVTYYIYRTN